jgi:hypothetical protein
VTGRNEKGLGRYGKEFLDRLGAVGVDERLLAGIDTSREALVFVGEAARPVGADTSRRHPGASSMHVEDVDELVDHDVVAPGRRGTPLGDVAPRKHQRAALHRLA